LGDIYNKLSKYVEEHNITELLVLVTHIINKKDSYNFERPETLDIKKGTSKRTRLPTITVILYLPHYIKTVEVDQSDNIDVNTTPNMTINVNIPPQK